MFPLAETTFRIEKLVSVCGKFWYPYNSMLGPFIDKEIMALKREIAVEIEKVLMMLEPEKYLAKHVSSARDVYENKYYLKRIICSDCSINHIADCILEAIEKR
jgi:hypothetical protein